MSDKRNQEYEILILSLVADPGSDKGPLPPTSVNIGREIDVVDFMFLAPLPVSGSATN